MGTEQQTRVVASWRSFVGLQFVHLVLIIWPSGLSAVGCCGWRLPVWNGYLLFLLLIGLISNTELAMTLGSASTDDGETRDVFSLQIAQIVGLMVLLGIWLAQLEAMAIPSHLTSTLSVAAAAIGLIGTILRASAIVALGTQYNSDVRTDNNRIQSGIYRYLSHPSEIGLLLIAISVPMVLLSWRTGLFLFVILFPISIWRIRREELAWRIAVAKD